MIKVLDKGFVDLVASLGNDHTIIQAARVLPEAEQRGEADIRLLSYLLKHNHTSPFEHVLFTFYVKAPIFVLRQWHRHRTWSFNEVSGRYKELPEEFYIPEKDKIGVQSKKNHQGRDLTQESQIDEYDQAYVLSDYVKQCEESFNTYRWLLDNQWPRELARCVLPLSTYSEMYATVDLHNLLHFLKLRNDEHAQFEIQEYSKAIVELITPIVPKTMEIWNGL